DDTFVLREYAPGVSIEEIRAKTAGALRVADDVREMVLTPQVQEAP
ncbi:hypothetical protein QMZ20_23425, partial [Serratia bockelmannii]|nr:hypothetical protein [Serratia bockelmannii]